MVSYHLLPSGSIRFFITVSGKRHYFTTKFRTTPDKWVNQRVAGKNSVSVNRELDRIEEEVSEWVSFHPIETYSDKVIKSKLRMIANKIQSDSPKRKPIDSYFQDFIRSKSTKVNTRTNKLVKRSSISHYELAFNKLMEFRQVEFEEITEHLYNEFMSHLLEKHKPNTVGKIIRKVKSFFTWSEAQGLPINPAYKTWKSFEFDTDEETRALNSKQLNRIYELEVDPIEVFELAKKLHKKSLDGKQITDLANSIKNAANQMVAVASIGPHIKDFYSLTFDHVYGDVIKYRRAKTNILCVAPFQDNAIWHAKEFANLDGGKLFKSVPLGKLRYYLTYIQELCNIPFKITPSSFRKTFGSIVYYESGHPNKLGIIMKAYGHKKESTTRKYLGIQDDDLAKDHSEVFV